MKTSFDTMGLEHTSYFSHETEGSGWLQYPQNKQGYIGMTPQTQTLSEP